MNVFIQKLNPITGGNDWVVQNEDYDYHQEIARSAFADMLHDTERNQLYERALKAAIEKVHAAGKSANVLDIGTGTGLLAMMAARNGADTVIACEAFKPMSKCAIEIIKLNGFQDKIKVIPKRSTALTLGEDLKARCNILVTEVFDTELIGEGALLTFSHAHKHLLEKDSIVVPQSATIFAQIVESPLVQSWNKLKDVYSDDGDLLLRIPESIKNCSGSVAVHDIQLSQLPESSFNAVAPPLPVLRFDWSGNTPLISERSTINTIRSERDCIAHAVFMWWELQMDTEGEIILSCAPAWAHPLRKKDPNAEVPWRDHWMQAIYFLPKELPVKKSQEIHLISSHDEYSLWFNLVESLRIPQEDYLQPICTCATHVTFSRTRIGQINDMRRNKKYLSLFEKYIGNDSTVLILSDGFYLGLAALAFGARKLYFVETNHLSQLILKKFIEENNFENVEIIENPKELQESQFREIDVVLGDPYFTSSIIPWDNLLFVFLLSGIRQYLRDDVHIIPKRATVKGVAMNFNDLHKIRCPLKSCEGFLMKNFDDLIQESSNISDDKVEAQPLWEYPGTALSDEIEIASIDLINPPRSTLERHGDFEIKHMLECNGLALWLEWDMDNSPRSVINTGPTVPIEVGKKVQWDMYVRQGVVLFPNRSVDKINYSFTFDFVEGSINFECR